LTGLSILVVGPLGFVQVMIFGMPRLYKVIPSVDVVPGVYRSRRMGMTTGRGEKCCLVLVGQERESPGSVDTAEWCLILMFCIVGLLLSCCWMIVARDRLEPEWAIWGVGSVSEGTGWIFWHLEV